MFDANIHCVIFGVNPALNKRCVLSIDPSDIQLPCFQLQKDSLNSVNETIIKFLKQYIFTNELELMPQLITIHSSNLTNKDDSMEIVYGFIIDYNSSIDPTKVYWIDFDPMKEHKLSPVLFETMQKLI